MQDDGLPNVTLPTEIVPPASGVGGSEPVDGDGDGDGDDNKEGKWDNIERNCGGNLKNCIDVGLVSGYGVTLFTYDCEEMPRDFLVTGKHHAAISGKSVAIVNSASPSSTLAGSKSSKAVPEEKRGASPKVKLGSGCKTGGRRTQSPPPLSAPCTFGSSPDKYPQSTSGYGSGYVVSPGKRDKLGRRPSPTKRPVMPAWHDDTGKTNLEHKSISFHPNQTKISEKMRKMATSTSWIPGVMSLSERAVLAQGGGRKRATDDDVSSIGSDNSHTTYTSMTSDLTTCSAAP